MASGLTRRRMMGGVGLAGVVVATGDAASLAGAAGVGGQNGPVDTVLVPPLARSAALPNPVVLTLGAIDFQPANNAGMQWSYVPPGGVQVSSGSAFFNAGLRIPAGATIEAARVFLNPNGVARSVGLTRYRPLDPIFETIGSRQSTTGSAPEAVVIDLAPHLVEEGWSYRFDNLSLTAGGAILYGAEVSYSVPVETGGFVPHTGPVARVYDSRLLTPLAADEERIIDLGVPGTARAAVFNLTVTGTGSPAGFVAADPAGSPWPGNSSINWSAPGLDVANLVVARTDASGRIVLRAGGASTHVVVDLVGSFS